MKIKSVSLFYREFIQKKQEKVYFFALFLKFQLNIRHGDTVWLL